jgi:hypothetical protein
MIGDRPAGILACEKGESGEAEVNVIVHLRNHD